MTVRTIGDGLFAVLILVTISMSGRSAIAADWKTVEVVRTGEMSDTSTPLFEGKEEKALFGKSKISLRCTDEGWGSVGIEQVRSRIALDKQLGLKSWPEVTKAFEKQGDGYLRGERMKFREIFVHDDRGPVHPRDELPAFGQSEKGHKYRFAKFDECSKVDTETLKPDQTCVVTLEVKDSLTKSGASGHVRYRSIKCLPKSSGDNISTETVGENESAVGGSRAKRTAP